VHSSQLKPDGKPSNGSANAPVSPASSLRPRKRGVYLHKKAQMTMRWLPSYAWQRIMRRRPNGHVHVMIALADHFEPSIVPDNGRARAPRDEQERRVESWCRDYPRLLDKWRDNDGRAFPHTYFYPAEQYDKGLLDRLACLCHAGWGEVEVHLHHGSEAPDTEENTRHQLLIFRDTLASDHGCLSYLDGVGSPRYAFVHGNFALANSAGGLYCGVNSEIKVLAETGCYADMTLPPGRFHPAHISKINSIYECSLPLQNRAAHRRGNDLEAGRPPKIFPLMVQGPLMLSGYDPHFRRSLSIEEGSLTQRNPASLHRLQLWKKAAIHVKGRPEWLFVKLQCHGMDPRDKETMLGAPLQNFLEQLVTGAAERHETLHFVCAREMVNIILAACDGREGDPGEYRDYRLKRTVSKPVPNMSGEVTSVALKS